MRAWHTLIFVIVPVCLFGQNADPSFFLRVQGNQPPAAPTGRLYYFLSTLPDLSIFTKVPPCTQAMGTFSFRISAAGRIDTVLVAGDLPDLVVNAYTNRIKQSTSGWKPALKKGKPVESAPFVWPVIFDYGGPCQPVLTMQSTYRLLTSLFAPDSDVISTPRAYLVRPLYIDSRR